MTDLISRKDAIDTFLDEVISYGLMDDEGNIESGCKDKDVIAMLENLQSVDAEPIRHGKWIMKSDPFGFFDEIPVCSECGCTTKLREKTKFCPNCGAKMDGGETE